MTKNLPVGDISDGDLIPGSENLLEEGMETYYIILA